MLEISITGGFRSVRFVWKVWRDHAEGFEPPFHGTECLSLDAADSTYFGHSCLPCHLSGAPEGGVSVHLQLEVGEASGMWLQSIRDQEIFTTAPVFNPRSSLPLISREL